MSPWRVRVTVTAASARLPTNCRTRPANELRSVELTHALRCARCGTGTGPQGDRCARFVAVVPYRSWVSPKTATRTGPPTMSNEPQNSGLMPV